MTATATAARPWFGPYCCRVREGAGAGGKLFTSFIASKFSAFLNHLTDPTENLTPLFNFFFWILILFFLNTSNLFSNF